MPERQLHRLKDLGFAQRVAWGFGLVLALFAVLALIAWQGDRRVVRAQHWVHHQVMPHVRAADALERAVLSTAAAAQSHLQAPGEQTLARFQRFVTETREVARALDGLALDDTSSQLYRRLRVELDDYLRSVDERVRQAGTEAVAMTLPVAGTVPAPELLDTLREFGTVQTGRMSAALDDAAAAQRAASSGLLWVGAAIVIVLCLLAMAVVGWIRTPTRALLGVAGALAAGNRRSALSLKAAADSGHPARRNEFLKLAAAFADAADAIERRERWLRAKGELAGAVASCLDRTPVAVQSLAAVVAGMQARAGVVYGWDQGNDELLILASQGGDADSANLRLLGDLAGQAVRSRARVDIGGPAADGAADDARMPAGFASAVPLLVHDGVRGALAVILPDRLDADALAFLESAARQLAVGLENIAAYERMQELLAEIQDNNTRIQTQNQVLSEQKQRLNEQNDRLLAQSAELAQTDRRKNEFLGLLAHELRNPMAPITTGLEMIQRSPAGSHVARHALAVIDRQVAHLRRLIDDLLDITRISRGKIVLKPKRIDFVSTVKSCVEDHRRAMDDKALGVTLELPTGPVWVDGDPVRLTQVIGNLIANAVKFTPQGGAVAVVLRRETGRHGMMDCVLRISDDGVGMSPELVSRLFEPFSQGETELDRRGYSLGLGLGLGLALVKSLVDLHGGSVAAHSDGENRGSCFEIRLPVAGVGIDPGPTPSVDAAGPAPSAPTRILVIDDNQDAANMLCHLLTLDGHQARAAYSGQDGLAAAHDLDPDLVLCDIGLPVMDGYEVARRFRADPALRDVILVALTGYALPEDRRRALDAGFDRHEAKPLTLERLRRLLPQTRRPAVSD